MTFGDKKWEDKKKLVFSFSGSFNTRSSRTVLFVDGWGKGEGIVVDRSYRGEEVVALYASQHCSIEILPKKS